MEPTDHGIVATPSGAAEFVTVVHDTTVNGIASLHRLVDLGGPIVAILLALSVVAVALILFKVVQFIALGVGRRRLAERAAETWIAGDREEAYDLARLSRSPVATVLAHAMRGVTRSGSHDAIAREDIERVIVDQLAQLRGMLRPIDMIGQTAPLLGLFGTVVGMIQAFQAMQNAGAAVDPSHLTGGIWVALLTTAVGLAIAIPATAIASWLDGRVEREREAMEHYATTVLTERITDEARGEERADSAGRAGVPAHAH